MADAVTGHAEPAKVPPGIPQPSNAARTGGEPPQVENASGIVQSNPDAGVHPVTTQPSTSYDTLFGQLQSLITEAGYNEVYGVTLVPSGDHVPTQVIVQKFLRANANDAEKAKDQLLSTLKWRKSFEPLKARDEVFSEERYGGLGYVIELEDGEIVTFNVYGAVKDNEKTFKDIQAFLRWRVGLMELGLAKLKLSDASVPVPAYGAGLDPYQAVQVHDYLNVSFLRQNPYVKAASKEAIALFSSHYPETLSRKLFVNVPVVMGWMFNAAKLMLSKETVRKFTVLSYGQGLAAELGPEGKGLPRVYGGEAGGLAEIGQSLQLV